MKLNGKILEPTNGNPPKKALIFMHGVGANGDNLLDIAEFYQNHIEPDCVYFLPDAPFAFDMMMENYSGAGQTGAYQWFSLADRSPKKILNGAKKAAEILDEYVNEISAKYALKHSDIAFFGFSQGTMLSLFYSLARPEAEQIGAVLGYSGRVVAPSFESKPPICLIHGGADDVVPADCLKEAEEFFTANNFDAEFHLRPNLMHSIDMQGIEIGANFLKKKFFAK